MSVNLFMRPKTKSGTYQVCMRQENEILNWMWNYWCLNRNILFFVYKYIASIYNIRHILALS